MLLAPDTIYAFKIILDALSFKSYNLILERRYYEKYR